MKKIITTLCLFSLALLGFSQASLHVIDESDINVSNGIHDVSLPLNASITTELFAFNSDSISHTYKCRRTVYTMASDDSTQFCWGGLCYNWGTSLSSYSLTIAPGDTASFADFGFHAIFKSKLSTITRYVHYQFYDTTTYSTALFYDSTGVTLRYNSFTGVDEVVPAGTISAAFPNPASAFVSMKYDINDFSSTGQIVLFDMLGKAVKQIGLTDKKGTAKINVDDLNAGVYFYSFLVDGKAITTKKLVISSK
ncbi:MAG: T9SS type A sorting domain-containing protein [Bacteroidetes bacterium]|nr:T9SS type A sorting domain-containing protein [Bacteroidota bacterium]